MTLILRTYCLMLLLLMLSACTGYRQPAMTPENFPGRYETRDLEIVWRLDRHPELLVVDGIVKNKHIDFLVGVELKASLLDAGGRRIGKEAVQFFPGRFSPNDTSSFTLKFPVNQADTPKKIKFFYSYHILIDHGSSIPQFNTFEAEINR